MKKRQAKKIVLRRLLGMPRPWGRMTDRERLAQRIWRRRMPMFKVECSTPALNTPEGRAWIRKITRIVNKSIDRMRLEEAATRMAIYGVGMADTIKKLQDDVDAQIERDAASPDFKNYNTRLP